MKRIATAICATLIFSGAANAQSFDNKNVIELHQAGIGDTTLLAKINSMPCGYDVTTDGLIALKNAGISDQVIAAMVDRCTSFSKAQGVNSNSADPSVAHPPGIYVMEDWLQPSKMQVIHPSKAGGVSLSGNGSILFPYVGRVILPDDQSDTMVKGGNPTFYFYFKADDRGVSDFGTANSVAAQSPDEFTLVKLKVKHNQREVIVGKASVFSVKRGIDTKDAIDFHSEEIGDGIFKVTVDKPISAGEYAFVITGSGNSARVYDFSDS